MNLLDKLAERDADWLRMSQSFGLEVDSARELVQEMYVHLYDKTTYDKIKYGDDDVNTFFVYVTLRNLYYDKQRKKVSFSELPSSIEDEQDIRNKKTLENLLSDLAKTIEDMHWYDQKIFEIYYGDGETIRELSEGSRISSSSIFNTIKNVRKKIQKKHQAKYQAYKEGK